MRRNVIVRVRMTLKGSLEVEGRNIEDCERHAVEQALASVRDSAAHNDVQVEDVEADVVGPGGEER